MALGDQVLRTIRRHALIAPGDRVVVALSGGCDSVALVHILRDLATAGHLAVAGLAHFNHQLRGAEADEDESFCRAMAASLCLPIEVGRADVRRAARDERRSVEDAARVLRYRFLEAAADRLNAAVIAVAHSLDDQAETFLLRLVRGSGPRGLAGILPRAGRVVRPLLDLPRAELRALVALRQLPYREDSSNADLTIARNRIRHELLPYLQREFSPAMPAVLAREASIAREDEDRLQQEATDLAGSIVLPGVGAGNDPQVELDAAALSSLHHALACRVARIGLAVLAAGRFVGFEHTERLLQFARDSRDGQALSLPGQRAVRRGPRVLLCLECPRTRAEAAPTVFRFPLSIPGEVLVGTNEAGATGTATGAGGWAISAETIRPADWVGASWRARGGTVAVAQGPLNLPLAVRGRRAGDRFRPLGVAGRQKLQDFLVNRRVPRESRDGLPLVVDDHDRIVWVVGESVAEDFRVTDPSQGVILLKARRLGGPG